jgi:hypothetical protein
MPRDAQVATIGLEQLTAGSFLEPTDLQADGRLRATEPARDPGHAALLHERHECAQERDIERSRHVPLHK